MSKGWRRINANVLWRQAVDRDERKKTILEALERASAETRVNGGMPGFKAPIGCLTKFAINHALGVSKRSYHTMTLLDELIEEGKIETVRYRAGSREMDAYRIIGGIFDLGQQK